MPVLENARHEKFCHAVAAGMSHAAAYEKAGYKYSISNASHLMRKSHISQRIAELRGEIEQQMKHDIVVDQQWVIAGLVELTQMHKEGVPSAAARAYELLGKELGMFVERSQNVNMNFAVTDEPAAPSEDDWEAEFGRPN